MGRVCPEELRPRGPNHGHGKGCSFCLAFAGGTAGPAGGRAGLLSSPLCPSPVPPDAGPQGLTWPTRLMAQVKQWLAMAAFLASTGHRDSL